MKSSTVESAIEFTKMWCNLFVGDSPKIKEAIDYFDEKAPILIPNIPFRLTRDADQEEVIFSHLNDGRGLVHYWQVLEPQVVEMGDVAVVTYYARYNIGRLGESKTQCAKETLVLNRTSPESKWRIAHMHNSF
jgi:SnoaL-like domain